MLCHEIFGFRFNYPLDIVPEAGPRESLHYYLYGKALSWDALRLDITGVPRLWQRTTGEVYNPAYIASYGLTNLGHYLRTQDRMYLDVFLRQVDWLEDHAVIREDGTVVWVNEYDYQEGDVLLKAPWVSANVQGFVISALVRGFRVTHRPHLLELLKDSVRVFQLTVDRKGIRLPMDGYILYTEKPGLPAPGILDGFLRSLLGLYDLLIETGDPKVGVAFRQGVEGLKYALRKWDYKGKWSWYGNRFYLSPPAYHWLSRLMLIVLARQTGESSFEECAERWDPRRLSNWDRVDIYLTHLFTKNACRWKHRTWRQKTGGIGVQPPSGIQALAPLTETLCDSRKLQVLALARLGWSIYQIEGATGIQGRAVGDYLKTIDSALHTVESQTPGGYGT